MADQTIGEEGCCESRKYKTVVLRANALLK